MRDLIQFLMDSAALAALVAFTLGLLMWAGFLSYLLNL